MEKAFQLSVRMPVVNEKDKKRFWATILGRASAIEEDDEVKVKKMKNRFWDFFFRWKPGGKKADKEKQKKELEKEKREEAKKEIARNQDRMKSPAYMEDIEKKYNLSQETVSDLVIESQNTNKREIKHLLEDFHSLIIENPRSIIRLANNYTMTSAILIVERKDQEPDLLFRWLALKDYCPDLEELIMDDPEKEELKKEIKARVKSLDAYSKCERLIDGFNDLKPLTVAKMKFYAGI